MKGLLYKEFRQNAFYIALTAITPFLVFLFPMFVLSEDFSVVNAAVKLANANNGRDLLIFAVLGFAAVGELQSLVFCGDDTKKWAYFIISSPEGIKGFLYTKYMLVLGMSGIFLAGMWFVGGIYGTVLYLGADMEAPSLAEFLVVFVYLQIFLRAIDIPFIVRYGLKQSGIIKLIAFVCMVLLFAVLIMANPEAILFVADRLADGRDADRISGYLFGLVPWAAIGAYVVSYKISCRLYRKGVMHYDK